MGQRQGYEYFDGSKLSRGRDEGLGRFLDHFILGMMVSLAAFPRVEWRSIPLRIVAAVAASSGPVIDLIAQKMQNHFLETSTELLLLVSCLNRGDSFSKFNIYKLLCLAELYPEDFSVNEHMMLEDQLTTCIYNVQYDEDFAEIGDLRGFAKKMVETSKSAIFPLIYFLIELTLVLTVVTASVEREFSAMNVVKTDLRNKMIDEWMNDSLVVYIEKEIFATIDN
ncbi:uncharacterized protein LOC120258120 [Dioscorea cayenensis subsp. rotundata]|uniref:Uncharacterized protein LOC120258120 n=1 Tax=Dioscorea cayennensis subsp. rotundata TaxID=55577 RepID=A0AB40B2C1_DIOCR|nr:uncharacterized protein LOC120258120 [Dioscorea cayenensis subsp. rotundata]